jgi:GH15 family glucan-1,4-alpha-glucosidase
VVPSAEDIRGRREASEEAWRRWCQTVPYDRDYGYRYGWIRDTCFVLDSFIQLGLTQEVQGTLAWMLSRIPATAPVIRPFYGLRGHGTHTAHTSHATYQKRRHRVHAAADLPAGS